MGVNFAHVLWVASEAFRPDFDFRHASAGVVVVGESAYAVLVWECFTVEPDAAHAQRQGVPVPGECLVEVLLDYSDAVVGFYTFSLDVFGGLE